MHHTFTPSACERLPFSGAERLLPAWNQYMGQARLSAERQVAYCHGIEAYSAFCRRHRLDATVETARRFMAESAGLGSLAPATVEVWKKALNWFFREARTHRSLALHGAPTLGRVDLGQTDWQRRPIERLRQLHYAWRTEETYRGWAWRYSESLDSRRVCWRRARITARCRICSDTWTWRGRGSNTHVMQKPELGVRSPLDIRM